MILEPATYELEYDPIASEVRRGIEQIVEGEMNGAKYVGYGYWLDNCGDGKWYCDHCYQRHECGKRITKEET